MNQNNANSLSRASRALSLTTVLLGASTLPSCEDATAALPPPPEASTPNDPEKDTGSSLLTLSTPEFVRAHDYSVEDTQAYLTARGTEHERFTADRERSNQQRRDAMHEERQAAEFAQTARDSQRQFDSIQNQQQADQFLSTFQKFPSEQCLEPIPLAADASTPSQMRVGERSEALEKRTGDMHTAMNTQMGGVIKGIQGQQVVVAEIVGTIFGGPAVGKAAGEAVAATNSSMYLPGVKESEEPNRDALHSALEGAMGGEDAPVKDLPTPQKEKSPKKRK